MGAAPQKVAGLPAVLALAARGWRVFPCRQRDKTPLVREWQHAATTDRLQIQSWHAEYLGCNWGVACGAGSGVWVLDVDGAKGKASLKALVKQYGSIPARLTVRTGKGLHLYFAWPPIVELRNSAGKIGEGLDVRGEGGYVLALGSVHPSGAVYAVAKDAPVTAAPEWLVQMAASPASPTIAVVTDDGRIRQGKGEPAKFALAVKMLKAGHPRDVVLGAVLALDKRCEHQLGEAECRGKVDEWADRYARRESLAGPRRAEVVILADVQPREVEWLWRPYLPAGMLAMLSGDPGAGKTYIALAIAAALTTGQVPYSSEMCAPVDVLYMSVENDPACVVRPRFDAMGGNPARLHLLRGAIVGAEGDAQHNAVWLTDTSVLRDALDRTHARLLIVDPIQSYLGAEVDAHRSNETRPVLDGLARLAEEYHCCLLLLRHLSKARGGRAIHAGLGSIDLTGAVRTELLAGSAPDDPQQRAVVQIKSNVGPFGASLGYIIDASGIFAWSGESILTQSDILAPEPAERDSTVDEAAEWLRNYLSAGERTAKDVESAARAAGYSLATIRRAKARAGVRSRKAAFGTGWVWQIGCPEDAQPPGRTECTDLSTFEKIRQTHEDAHEDAQKSMLSTFAENEHVRQRGDL